MALTTLGVHMGYATTKTATSFEDIPGLKSIPSLSPAPDALESSTLAETEYKTYEEGLKDLGGALEFTSNFDNDFVTAWEAMITAQNGTDGKKLFFCVAHPDLDKAVRFEGKAAKLGLPETGVNAIWEATDYITPTGAPEFIDRPDIKSGNTIIINKKGSSASQG